MLRTVTFSDPEVQKVLDTQFVLTWHNQAQDLFPGKPGSPGDHQPAVSEHYLRTFPDGAGGGNVRMFFCTPDARVVHSIEGYYRPATFLQEVAFARELLAGAAARQATASEDIRQRVAKRRDLLDQERRAVIASEPTHALLRVLVDNLDRTLARLWQAPDAWMINENHAIA